MDDDRVFKALADPTRRHLLDRLIERDGRRLTELESELEMTRFGVMKHLSVLEGAGLVVTRRAGREKQHFLNPVPIRLVHDRWIDKYTEHRVEALSDRTTRRDDAPDRRARPARRLAENGRQRLRPRLDARAQRPEDAAGDRGALDRLMDFDRFTIVLLLTNPDAPDLGDEEAAELQDAHMNHL